MSQSWLSSKIHNPDPGWYRGELHAHSSHSDGYHSPPKMVRLAQEGGLEFLAITDHNRVDAYPLPELSDEFLVIPSIEITTQSGHFNIFGLSGRASWMENICIGYNTIKLAGAYDTPTALMRQVTELGLICSINHPFRAPFDWQDKATELRYVNCLEIWNKPDWPDPSGSNLKAIALWTRWLNAGHRTIALGGSDYHTIELRPGEKRLTERLGWPRNYIYAESLSSQGILAGLREGHVYVSMGPEISFQAELGGQTYQIGDDLGQVTGEILFTAGVYECETTASAQLIKNGEVVAEKQVACGQVDLHFYDQADPAEPAWYRLDVYNEQGEMLVLTNPIYVGPRRRPELTKYGDFQT